MTKKLTQAIQKQKKASEPVKRTIAGSLGLFLNGEKVVEVANRNSFVYVRLRDNQSEVIQAFNNQVSPSYDLPVLVERQGTRYIVTSVDTQRYQNNWNSFSPFLPRHGNTHSFDPASGGAGDVVFVYPRQFMPSLIIPSGSDGGPNVLMSSYTMRDVSQGWKFTGNTGTLDLTPYKPTDTSAVMVLTYLDWQTGNPGFLVNSGSYFSASITGTAEIVPYIPSTSNMNYIPLSAIRLVSGTSVIGWDNIYDVRQFLTVLNSGTGGGGGGINTGTLNSLYLRLDTSNDPLTSQLEIIPSVAGVGGLYIETQGDSFSLDIENYVVDDDSSSPNIFLYRETSGNGNIEGPMIQGYQSRSSTGTITGDFISLTDLTTGAFFTVDKDGNVNIPFGSEYRIGGSMLPASSVANIPIPGISSTNVQAAINELEGTKAESSALSAHISNPTGAHVASAISSADAGGYWDGDDVEEILQEIGSEWPNSQTDTNDIFRCDSPGGVSAFTGTIATLPGGATLTYNVSSGQEGAMVPTSTGQLAKMRLYNTTRGTSLLISNCVTGTNTLTFTANVPGAWQVGDTITIVSQTVSGGSFNWVDLEITSGITNKNSIFAFCTLVPGAAGDSFRSHPFETFGNGKVQTITGQVASVIVNSLMLIKVTSNVFSIGWSGTPTTVLFRLAGYIK